MTLDERINSVLGPIADVVSNVIFFAVPMFGTDVPLIVAWLVIAGVIFTIAVKGLSFRGLRHALQLTGGKYDQPDAPGEITHFQAISTAMTNTLGLGNIAGVAIAITLGGPGAIFWMIIAGLFAMATKMVACTLGVKYRTIREDGTISGGPFYYLTKGMAEIGRAHTGKIPAVFYAIAMALAMIGIMSFQANQATAQVVNTTTGALHDFLSGNLWILGLVMAVMGGLVVFGGVRKIASTAAATIPFMSVLYILGCLTIVAMNFSVVPAAFGEIFRGAFDPAGVAGGVLGALIVGFQRAAFSNAAGLGDAPVAHAAVKTNRPATEGFTSSLEPLFDTVVLNTLSALAIIVTGAHLLDGNDGVQISSAAFATVATWFVYIFTIAVFLFAFTSVIACSYYGAKAVGYLFGNKNWIENVYKAVVLVFIVIGSSMSLDAVVSLADSLNFTMAIFNIIGLYFLLPIVRRELFSYWRSYKNGELPVSSRTARRRTEVSEARRADGD